MEFMADPIVQKSVQYFESGYYCAESVLKAVAESRGIQSELIPRIATGFCSGVARTSGMCGALSGAIMAIGLVSGRDNMDDSVEPSYDAVQTLVKKVEAQFGACNCFDLIGCRLDTEAGQHKYMDGNKMQMCTNLVGEVTRLVLEVLGATEREVL
jgi:C_GCAxxG_C_C family probable redox protein